MVAGCEPFHVMCRNHVFVQDEISSVDWNIERMRQFFLERESIKQGSIVLYLPVITVLLVFITSNLNSFEASLPSLN